MPKKLCFISPFIYPLLDSKDGSMSAGGAEIQFKTIGEALSSMDCQVDFIVGDYGQEKIKKYGAIRVFQTSFRYLGGGKYYLPIDWVKFLILLNRVDADVYFLKIPKDLTLPLGLYCRFKGKKLVYVGQSDKDVNITLLSKLQNRLAVYLYRLGLFFVDYALAQTAVQASGFNSFGIRSEVVRNIITLPDYHFSSSQSLYVLWVGNDTDNKQPDLFCKLARNYPQYNFTMIMATEKGSASDIKYRGLSEKVENFKYLGFVPFEKIAPYFAHASVLVSTSLREGFPNVFLQAWQYGVPVVSLHVDPDGVIEKYGLGRYVAGDYDHLCGAVDEFMSDSNLCIKVGESAKKYVRRTHSVEVVVNQYRCIIEKL